MKNLPQLLLITVCLLLTGSTANGQAARIDSNPAPSDIKWKSGKHLLNLVAWNVQSGDNDPAVIAEQLKDFSSCDIVALNEVNKRNVPAYATALGDQFEAFVSETGGSDHLAILFDSKRFELLEKKEMHQLNNGTHRSPIYVRLKEQKTGQEFVFMTNHLARRNDKLRQMQAAGLREWARDSSTPIIAMGDFNFDYSFKKQKGNQSFNEFMRDGVWEWVKPDPFIDSQWSDVGGRDKYPDSMLDFVFVANGAKAFESACEIVVRAGDFPDNNKTSDHRATRAEILLTPKSSVSDVESVPTTQAPARQVSGLENGVVTYLESDGHQTEVKFDELTLAERKQVMEATGWGRIWEDKGGTHHTIANLVEVTDTAVVLEKVSGKQITVPLAKLSKTDREYATARKNLSGELPEHFQAKVIAVVDGNTVTVLLNSKQYKIRIAGIDTPEKGQAFSQKAKKHLSGLVFGKQVTGIRESLDRYGRNVCSLSVDGVEVEKEMLRVGLAWHYIAHSKDPIRQQLEDQAKAEKLNLWSEAAPIPPWDWRKWGTAKRKNWLANKEQAAVVPARTTTQVVTKSAAPAKTHWLNSKSGARHNAGCRWFGKTKSGHMCTSSEGHACGQCGG